VADAARANAALIERFYSAFARRDVETMLSCYRPDVVFRDPVFGALSGQEVRAMWRMLNARAADLAIEFGNVAATGSDGSAHWEARYTYTATGRRVHNRIDASFEFRDGSIARHVDRFREPLNKSHMSRVSGAMALDARRRGAANSAYYSQAAQRRR